MNESEFQQLRETSWRRPLSREEEARVQAWLTGHPDAQADWEDDAALGGLLAQLPDVPVASNFTSRVLQQADSWQTERDRQARLDRSPWRRLARWLPQTAAATLMLVCAISGYRIFQEQQKIEQLAPGVELVQKMSTLPHPESLRDFTAIQHLSAVPHPVDFELLEALE